MKLAIVWETNSHGEVGYCSLGSFLIEYYEYDDRDNYDYYVWFGDLGNPIAIVLTTVEDAKKKAEEWLFRNIRNLLDFKQTDENIAKRDAFIVSKGLWQEFLDTLK